MQRWALVCLWTLHSVAFEELFPVQREIIKTIEIAGQTMRKVDFAKDFVFKYENSSLVCPQHLHFIAATLISNCGLTAIFISL